VFTTERLLIRAWDEDEADVMLDIYRRLEVAQWLGAVPAPLETLAEAYERIARWNGLIEGPYGIWALCPMAGGPPVGTVLLRPMPDGQGTATTDVEVGWHLHPDAWGRGYATEAAAACLPRAWGHGDKRVWAVVREGNARSIAVTQRLGMRPHGVVDRWYGLPLLAFSVDAPLRSGGPAA
jgi:RimJ/RimL family protein N-acetyltransferase